MNTVIDLRSYVSASNSRLLVMVDLQEATYDELAKDRASDLACSIANCPLAIRHARNLGLPIAITRPSGNPGMIVRAPPSAWISAFEPKRSDQEFEPRHPSCYTNQLSAAGGPRIGTYA